MSVKESNIAPYEFFVGKNFMDNPPNVPASLIDPLIPGLGVTLLHGSPGVGKSTILWTMGQCVSTGTPFLGLPTTQGKVLLVCLDMNRVVLYQRWYAGNFRPEFDVLLGPPVDVIRPEWLVSEYGRWFKKQITNEPYDLVLVDALGECFLGNGSSNDIPPMVYGAFRAMLPSASIVFAHHDRKRGRDQKGGYFEPSGEDALGSILWKAYANSTIQTYKVGTNQHDKGEQKRRLVHTKTHSGKELPPVDYIVGEGGCRIEGCDQHDLSQGPKYLTIIEKKGLSEDEANEMSLRDLEERTDVSRSKLGRLKTIYLLDKEKNEKK